MEITLRGKHFDVPAAAAERAKNKFGRLDHFLPLLKDGNVEIDVAQERSKDPNRRYAVRAFVSANGIHLRAEERAAKLEAAIDQAAHVLAEQARRHKQRLYGKTRHASRASTGSAEAVEAPEPEDANTTAVNQIAQVERVSVKPMTVEEAVEQIGLLGRDFFVFLEGDEQRVALLYRRSDGRLGLVVPELS
jgi:putative sigma-54 modulation protein